MKKIALIGSPGSGKSTLARQLSEKLKLDVYHLDALLWNPGWVGKPRTEQIQIQEALVQKEEWIIDGNYGETIEIRLQTADTVIFLNIHRMICMYRAFKRILQYWNKTRPDMQEGCRERVDVNFFNFIWNYPKTKKADTCTKLKQLPAGKQVIILNSPKEVQRFLEMIK